MEALDRTKLEQKDRAELATIVEAMGGKATSRAKKADLVDLVVQLAGVGDDDAPEPEASTGVEAEPAPEADTGPSLPEPAVTIPDGAVGSDEEPLAEWEQEVDDRPEAAPAPARGNQPRAQQGRGDGGPPRGQHCLLYTSDAADE